MRIGNTVVTLVLVGAICAGIISTMRGTADADVPRAPQVTAVRTAAVESAPERVERVFYGLVQGADQANVAFAQPGRLVVRHVDVGDLVEAGAPIAELERDGLRNAVRAASAQLDELNAQREQLVRDLERARGLLDARLGNEASIEQLEAGIARADAGIDAASAGLAEARRGERETVVYAPCAGVVTDVFAEPGEVLGAGMPVVRLDAGGALEVRLDVPESVFSQIDVGAEVQVRFPLSDLAPVVGTVRSVSSANSAVGRLFPVYIQLPESPGAAAGMSAEVSVPLPGPTGVAIPAGSVVDPTGEAPAVFRVVEGVVSRVPVTLVDLTQDSAIVRGPLVPGEAIVTAGVHRVADGMAVEVLP